MGKNRPEQAIERTSEKLLSAVFPGLGRVAESPAQGIFSAIVRTGSPQNKFGFLVRPDLRHRAHGEPSGKGHRRQLKRGGTSLQGLQEKVSGWLSRCDFARPLRDYLWREAQPLLGRDTVIAVVSGDFSKEFGGAGLEGMEMGDDASRGIATMGHILLCAAVVLRKRAMLMVLALLKGQKGLPDQEIELSDKLVAAIGGRGLRVHDRGFDSEDCGPRHLFGPPHSRPRQDHDARPVRHWPAPGGGHGQRSVRPDGAAVAHATGQGKGAWRRGFFPVGDGHLPVLVVASTFDDTPLYLYALSFGGGG